MRPIRVLQTNTGDTPAIPLDYRNLADVSLQAVVVSGSPTWTIQQTLDDPFDTSLAPTWFDHPDTNLVGQTVNRQGNFDKPVRACRLRIISGTGVVALTVVQAELRC